jgi:DNA-directed RNA polymerase specialized sigma24 family protein
MKLRHRRHELTIASTDQEFESCVVDAENLVSDEGPNPEEEYENIERSRVLADAIRELPERYRAVLELCDIDGLMEKETAQRLCTVVSVIRFQRHRGRRMLLRRLKYRQTYPRRRTEELGHNPGFEAAPDSCPRTAWCTPPVELPAQPPD